MSDLQTIRSEGLILLDQGRLNEARERFFGLLRDDPGDAWALAMLSLVALRQEEKVEAVEFAEAAVSSAPDWSYAHVTLARAQALVGRLKPAESSARTAVELDPESDVAQAALAMVLARSSRWKEALVAIDEARRLDPDDADHASFRSHILQALGRREEALQEAMLSRSLDPEDTGGMTAEGYALLRDGRRSDAEAAFAEALRTDPTDDFAREGLLESLRVRFWPYRLVYGFFAWQERFTEPVRWGLWIGLFLVVRGIREVARANPGLAVPLLILAGAYSVFVFLTWTSRVLANGVLLLHPMGRLALEPDDRREGALAGILGLLMVVFALAAIAVPEDLSAVLAAGVALLLVGLAAHLHSVPLLRRILVWILGPAGILGSLLLGIGAFFVRQPGP